MAKSVAAVALVLAGSASAFVGAPLAVSKGASSARSSLVMKLGPQAESLVGASFELGGNTWDPVGFSNNPNAETIAWYRAAELKHGRVVRRLLDSTHQCLPLHFLTLNFPRYLPR